MLLVCISEIFLSVDFLIDFDLAVFCRNDAGLFIHSNCRSRDETAFILSGRDNESKQP